MTSFSELFASVQARRESGDLAGALALFEGRERDFPLQKGLVFLVRAELLAELRQPDQAIESLDAALASAVATSVPCSRGTPSPRPSPASHVFATSRSGRLAGTRGVPRRHVPRLTRLLP